MKKYIIIILILLVGFLVGYYFNTYQSNKKTNAYLDSLGLLENKETGKGEFNVPVVPDLDPDKQQRINCYEKYARPMFKEYETNVFMQAEGIVNAYNSKNDVLNLDKTNPNLYACINKLKNPLGI